MSSRRLVAFVFVSVPLGAACASPTSEVACALYAKAEIDHAERCGVRPLPRASDLVASCERLAAVSPGFRAHVVEYSVQRATVVACFTAGVVAPGPVTQGGACASDWDCASTHCRTGSAGSYACGTCAAAIAEGGACTAGGTPCLSGASCVNGLCAAQRANGLPCADGLECLSSTCTGGVCIAPSRLEAPAWPSAGSACTTSASCKSGDLTCASGTCVAVTPGAVDAACGDGKPGCRDDLACVRLGSAAQGACRERAPAGRACLDTIGGTDCGSGLFCEGGVCATRTCVVSP